MATLDESHQQTGAALPYRIGMMEIGVIQQDLELPAESFLQVLTRGSLFGCQHILRPKARSVLCRLDKEESYRLILFTVARANLLHTEPPNN